MTKIALRHNLFYKVKDGTKTSTARFGVRGYPLGDAIFYCEETGETVNIQIKALIYQKFNELTLEDALRDGYKNLKEFKETLLNIYPQTLENDEYTIVVFKYIAYPIREHLFKAKRADNGEWRLIYGKTN